MALPSFAKETITVQRATTKLERGVEVLDWDNPKTHTIDGCSVQLSWTNSHRDSRDAIVLGVFAYLPPDADIAANDKVIYEGAEYCVDGAPFLSKSPTGRLSYIRASLKEWEG